jgi:ribosomal protein S18 acetylase RimI-like enzyme
VREGDAGSWELDTLYLAPEWRGFGLGRALVEQAIRSVQQAGGLRLACKVPADLSDALALFKRLGFEEEAGGRAQTRVLAKALGRIS